MMESGICGISRSEKLSEVWTADELELTVRNCLGRDMELITNVTEYEKLAKEKLPKMVYDYYASGAEDQWTLKENREAFSRIL